MTTVVELEKMLPSGSLKVGGTRIVGRGEGSTVEELFRVFRYQPIQFKGVELQTRTNLLLTKDDLIGDDWERYDQAVV